MAWFRKIRAGLVKSEITDFVGEKGHIFYNDDSGEFRYSDGVTPFGHPICTCGSNPGGGLPEEEIKQLIDSLIVDGTLHAGLVEAEQEITIDGAITVNTPADLKLGTEEIYLNGIRLSEGANRDYSINSASINFLNGWELFNQDVINIVYVKE